jgi:hypothetical protein
MLSWRLAKLVFPHPGDDSISLTDRRTLYSAASFLVGLWLLSDAIPAGAYYVFWAVRTGWRPFGDATSGAQVTQLMVKGILGLALVRGTWLTRLVEAETPVSPDIGES